MATRAWCEYLVARLLEQPDVLLTQLLIRVEPFPHLFLQPVDLVAFLLGGHEIHYTTPNPTPTPTPTPTLPLPLPLPLTLTTFLKLCCTQLVSFHVPVQLCLQPVHLKRDSEV